MLKSFVAVAKQPCSSESIKKLLDIAPSGIIICYSLALAQISLNV